jgi:hypothetical protein
MTCRSPWCPTDLCELLMVIVLRSGAESSSAIRPSGMSSRKFSVIDGSSNTIYCSWCHLNGLRTPFRAMGSFWYPRIIAGSKISPSSVLMRNGGSLSRGSYFCWGSDGGSLSRGSVWSDCCFSTPFPLSISLLVVFTLVSGTSGGPSIRAAHTGVFDLDIRISNRPFIDVCKSFAAETGLESRNVEKRINACLSGPIASLSVSIGSCRPENVPTSASAAAQRAVIPASASLTRSAGNPLGPAEAGRGLTMASVMNSSWMTSSNTSWWIRCGWGFCSSAGPSSASRVGSCQGIACWPVGNCAVGCPVADRCHHGPSGA